jgi:hypothetical protein
VFIILIDTIILIGFDEISNTNNYKFKSIRVVNKKPLEKAAKINRGNACSKHRYRFIEVVA